MVTEILKAIFFGIVEGITEWLPISSTGHMILLNEFVKLQVSDEFYKLFEVVIQLGAILAVILLFFHKLNPFSPSKSAPQRRNTWRLWFKVVLAVIPSAVIGLPLAAPAVHERFTEPSAGCPETGESSGAPGLSTTETGSLPSSRW